MRLKMISRDLGDDVIYGVGTTPDLTLLVINSRPVTRMNVEYARTVAAQSHVLHDRSAEQRRSL